MAIEQKELIEVDGLDALLAAGRRLRDVDPDRFQRLLSLARAYVAIHDRPTEPEDVFLSRLMQVLPTPKARA
jgi:hypothetical protein